MHFEPFFQSELVVEFSFEFLAGSLCAIQMHSNSSRHLSYIIHIYIFRMNNKNNKCI